MKDPDVALKTTSLYGFLRINISAKYSLEMLASLGGKEGTVVFDDSTGMHSVPSYSLETHIGCL